MARHIAHTKTSLPSCRNHCNRPSSARCRYIGNRIHSGLFSLSLSKRRRTPPHASPHASWILRRCHLVEALREERDTCRKDLDSFGTTMEKRMYNILTIIGFIVVVLAVLAFFGLR
jgi:hypothetical protein